MIISTTDMLGLAFLGMCAALIFGIGVGYGFGKDIECRRIVRWLRSRELSYDVIEDAADRIERGEHGKC